MLKEQSKRAITIQKAHLTSFAGLDRWVLQRRAVNQQPNPYVAPPIVHEVLRGAGRPLDQKTRSFMEPRFGHNFSHVRVHTDAKAAASARTVNAQAYTVGSDLVFENGLYRPDSDNGQRLLAHELAHVVQQGKSNNMMQNQLVVGSAVNQQEKEAERTAEKIATDQPYPIEKLTQKSMSMQRACGPVAIGEPENCMPYVRELNGPRYLFDVNCDDFAPGNEEGIRADASRIVDGEIVEIHGLASIDGDAIFNRHLSCARALKAQQIVEEELAQRGISAIIRVFSHGATEGDATQQRSVVMIRSAPEPPEPVTPAEQIEDIKVVVKSFIAFIGSRVGVILPLGFPVLVDPVSITETQVKLRALAAATDIAFNENPRHDRKDKGYRLYSERTFRVTCRDGNLTSVIPLPLDTDAGTECVPGTSLCLQPPPLITSDIKARRAGTNRFEFGWFAKGRPHLAAEPAFQLIRPRTSRFIWHKIEGNITCSSSGPDVSVRLSDSRFPSDRVFINSRPIGITHHQGTFSSLWDAGVSDPTLVR